MNFLAVTNDPAANLVGVLTAVTLAAREEFSVHTWTCSGGDAAWSDAEQPSAARLVLVRSGRFRRKGGADGPVDLDTTIGYLGAPGDVEHFAHPDGGDQCTSVQPSAQSWWQLVGEPGRVRRSAFYVEAQVEFAHRRLLAAGHDPDYRLAEEVLRLLGPALQQAADRRIPLTDRPSPTDRRLVERARAAIHEGHPCARGLFPLAALLDASPYRLSRSFTRELGVSITRYRNRVRIGQVLEALQRDESTLADLACTLGFADQAHLTRAVRTHLGRTPTAARRDLAG